MKTYLWLLFLLLSSFRLVAQPLISRNLSLQQGLPEYYVSGIVQDKAGFIWIATRDGLARYDGRQFNVFRHQPFRNRSLADNVILSLESVSDTTLLIHLDNGAFQLFNPLTERFTDLFTPRQLAQSHIDLANALLVAKGRLVWSRLKTHFTQFDRQTKRFRVYPFPQLPTLGLYPGNSFLMNYGQHLYAPFPGQLIEFDTRKSTFHCWVHPLVGRPGKIPTYYGTSILQRTNGEILIGGVQQLIGFNSQTHQFRSIPFSSSVHTQVGQLYQATDGNVYFTHAMTVYRLAPDDQITPIWTAPRIDYQNYFHALLVDRSGVLWIGTNGDGIQQVDLRALPIKSYPYRINFVHDVLVTELGLSVPEWTKTNGYIYQLRLGGTAPYLTISTNNSYQLLRGDPASHRFRSLLKLPQANAVRRVEGGNGIRVLADSTIWMYDPDRGLLKADATGRLLARFSCQINWVSSIQPVNGQVWVGSEVGGLYGYDLKTRRISRHLRYQPTDSTSLPSNHVLCLAADPTNPRVLWVGTQEGLSRLDTRTMRCHNWTENKQMPSATINTLLADRWGNLWFSTVKGISQMNPRTGQMRHFSTADGLQDIEYRQNHAVQLPDGRMAFGGATGVTLFDPLALHERAYTIPTVLTSLRLANVPVEPGQQGGPLRLPLNATTTLRLGPTQNFLTLEFAGLQYNKPASLRYRYQLTGVDPRWVYTGSQNVANYTQLAPGDYAFRVNTADASGHWSRLVKTIRIIVDPPWWQTGWAYGLYVLLTAGLVRAYIQYRINRAELRQEARLTKQHADWQTRFFTNITHEFRTPLTLIINPLERLMAPSTKLSRDTLGQQYGVMYRNAQRLLRLINQLLDIAKLEAGQLALTESQGNLSDFFADLVDSFRLRAQKKGIQLTYDSSGLTADYRFDAQKLETIGYNLLANAVNFTESGGQIQVSLTEERLPDGQSGFQLRVADTGCGIAAEQLERIFDRFFQVTTAEASLSQGTGIGLFLVAEFTKLLGGNVVVESQLGQGTSFRVSLPLGQADGLEPVVDPRPSETIANPEAVSDSWTAPATAPLVLVVEDNEELREFMASELTANYRVLIAANGQAGWQLCLDELPELVISDVMMPLMDGFTLVERIKTTPLTAHIAVILLTAKTMANARIQGLTAGANDYLTKPFHAQELSLRIANLLHHQQQLRHHWQQRIGQLAEIKSPAAGPVADDPFLVKLYQVLDRELANSSLSVEQLADELAVSYRTLHRKVSILTGTNANELIRSHRLQQAAGFLQEGCSISEAAEKTGFEGLSYFAKSFKAQFGVTPSAYLHSQGHQ